MPVTVTEQYESRPTTLGDQSTVDLIYAVVGTDSDVTAHAELLSTAPALYGGLALNNSSIKRIAQEAWLGTVRYKNLGKKDTGDSTFQFDTGGGSQKITQSLSTTRYAPAGETAPDFQGAIGVTNDSVEGVDITVPVYNFSETHYVAAASVDAAYKLTLFSLTGRVNNATFKGFAAGEVLFLGASGTQRNTDDWEITYRFAASPNVTGLTVGSITGINKLGWEYMWVRYEDTEDTAAKRTVKRPIAVFVEQVYETGDMSLLGI